MKAKIAAGHFSLRSQGLSLQVFMAKPEQGGPLPAVLINHGGGGMEPIYQEMCLYLAGIGYVALAMTFRGYPGSEGRQEYGKGEIEDLLNLAEHLKAQSFVDKSRMGMFGYSRGALNTLLACERSRDFRAAVLWSVPVEMVAHHAVNPFIQDLIGGSPEEIPGEYRIRSPIHFVEGVACPLLIIHGEWDDVIPVQHAYMLARELERKGKDFQLKIYPGEGHSFTPQTYQDAWGETVSFLNRHLL